MVFLILVVMLGIPIIIVSAKLIAFAFWLSSDAFFRFKNRFLRFLARFAFLVISVGVSIPISLSLQPLLPDFRTQGDGGVGMAHNALSIAALFTAVPCSILIVFAFALSRSVDKSIAVKADTFDVPPSNNAASG